MSGTAGIMRGPVDTAQRAVGLQRARRPHTV